MAIKNPEKYVLKPQREGGGNNIYGKEVSNLLSTINVSRSDLLFFLGW